MEKRNIKKSTATLLILCILFTLMTGCMDGGTSRSGSENEIYPTGDICSAKVFDPTHNEKAVSLNRDDVEFILLTLKDSKKDLVTGYADGLLELNITFTDSVIQLVREDDETIYYVFHNNKINGICYRINSKELSKLILTVSS